MAWWWEGQRLSHPAIQHHGTARSIHASLGPNGVRCRSPTNPKGWIPLAVAENKLSNKAMLHRIMQVGNPPTSVLNYGGMKGMKELQEVMAALLQDTFVPRPTLDPNRICLLSGASAILDAMFYCLGEDEQSVLIPAPYYPAFDNDLSARNNLVPTPVYLEMNDADTEKQLTAIKDATAAAGRPAAALLVSNPNNPLGTVYSDAMVRSMLLWCIRHKIHYVSDEIYALSVFKDPTREDSKTNPSAASADELRFVSALSLTEDLVHEGRISRSDANTYVHLVYGLSKDWSASGLRVGLLYSNNETLQLALSSLAPFAGISNHTQYLLMDCLVDKQWRDQFIQDNQKVLERSYDVVTGLLDDASIPYQQAVAGIFVWIDLRRWLSQPTWEGESNLWQKICDDAKVILTPGKSCHAQEPGYFRICYAWMPVDALQEALNRLTSVLSDG